ncbi:MAG: DUF1697 domain-containing protein [Ardenticatenales bacterium]|nr:DUF1697 domain-containing protein [Ardenticatenales bacterium]
MTPPRMPKTIAFLRAINVGGHNVKMEQLRALFEQLGFDAVETFIASGNVVFETDAAPDAGLEADIEAHLKAALGYEVATFLRTDAEVAAVAAYEPLPAVAMAGVAAFNVGFLTSPLTADEKAVLAGFNNDIDDFHSHGREVYWLCRTKQSDSKFNNNAFERALRRRATFRGRNTVLRLAAKYPPSSAVTASGSP